MADFYTYRNEVAGRRRKRRLFLILIVVLAALCIGVCDTSYPRHAESISTGKDKLWCLFG